MKLELENSKVFWIIFGLLGAFAFLGRLDFLPLAFEEPRRAIVALEMMVTGDYIAPRINGFYYFNKPPIYNWLLIFFFKLFGHSDWVVRLPTVLSLFAICGVNFFVFKRKLGSKEALLSSLCFLTSADVLFYFSFQGEIDMFYTLIVYLQVITIICYYERKDSVRLFLFSYLLMAIGLLTKGLPSVAFQGLTLLGIAFYDKKWKWWFHWSHVVGAGLGFGLVALFFYTYSRQNPVEPYLMKLFSESASRATLEDKSFWDTYKHFFDNVGIFLRICLPWLLISFFYIRKSKIKTILGLNADNRYVALGVIFVVSNIWLYWWSPVTRNRYLYMFMPFVFNTISYFLVHSIESKKLRNRSFGILFGALTGIAAWIPLVLPFVPVLILDTTAYVILGLSFVILVGLNVLFYKVQAYQKMLVFAAVFLTIRIIFNYAVLPVRLKQDFPIDDFAVAEKIFELTKGDQIYFYEKPDNIVRKVPFTTKTIDEPTLWWLPYQWSYYWSVKSSKVLQYSDHFEEGRFFILDARHKREDWQELYHIKLPRRGQKYVLVRI